MLVHAVPAHKKMLADSEIGQVDLGEQTGLIVILQADRLRAGPPIYKNTVSEACPAVSKCHDACPWAVK